MLFGTCCIAVHDADRGWGCGGSSTGCGLRDVGGGLWDTQRSMCYFV